MYALQASNLGRRFGRKWVLRDCDITFPVGRVSALVGPNGAGKSTLLRIGAGLIPPSTGSLKILGSDAGMKGSDLRGRIGFLDQNRPLYRSFNVKEMLHFGKESNHRWNDQVAFDTMSKLNIPLDTKVRNLSGGQRAQLALTLCIAKTPELFLLDEPAAELDLVAREDLLKLLMNQVANYGSSVILSTHSLTDVSSVCDYIVVLSQSQVVLANDIEFVLESHRILTSPRNLEAPLPAGAVVIEELHNARQFSVLARLELPLFDQRWKVESPTLDEIVMGYLRLGHPLKINSENSETNRIEGTLG